MIDSFSHEGTEAHRLVDTEPKSAKLRLFSKTSVVLVRDDTDGKSLFFPSSKSNFGSKPRARASISWEWCAGDRLEDRTLACGLISNDDDLGRLDTVDLGKLEFVDQVEEASLIVSKILVHERLADRERFSWLLL